MSVRKTVLITGHHGYLGRVLVEEALKAGWAVRGLDNGLYCPSTGLPAVVQSIGRDIRDVMPDDLDAVDAVIHTAAMASDGLGERFPEATSAINVAGTARLLQLAQAAGVSRFVHTSSVGVYAADEQGWCDERSPLAPGTRYRQAKVAADQAVLAADNAGFAALVVRLPTMFGDSPSLRLDLVVNAFVERAIAEQPLEINGPGTQWRPLAHVRDIARLLVMALDLPHARLDGRVVNLCRTAMNLRVIDVAEHVSRAFGGLAIHHRPASEQGMLSYRVRSCRLDKWFPDVPFRHDLAAAIAELQTRLSSRPLDAQQRMAGHRDRWIAHQIESGQMDSNLRLHGAH